PSVVLDTSSAQSVGGVTLFGYGVGQRSDAAAPLYWGVDEEGVIVWYLHDTSVTRADPLIRALDDGNLLVVLENEARIVTPAGETVASRDLSAVTGFHHDVVLLSDGHLVALGQERVTIDGVTLWNDTIHELDAAGNEVWRWSAAEHLDTGRFPGALSTTETRGGLDWSHANALFAVDGEDALLFSSRSQGWVVKIDRSSGDVLWILGDGAGTSPGFDAPFFGLNAGSWFTAQHAPMIDSDGHLLLYDNRNESGGASANSRVVAYALDETAMAASQQWEYVVPKYTASLGDVDEIAAGHRLVCAGGPAPGDDHARVIEIGGGDTPTALWGIIVDAPVYRAERVAWAGFR
ncbi:MAG: aryl-sulfate sulfotransferase, partial [Ectothiorhodospiraceae bacterium]|nr:aryl-sulfate sulfotransferase [Ectothiorhodospiraceae bacterium]